MSEQRYCVDCRWHAAQGAIHWCMRKKAGDPVTGWGPVLEHCCLVRNPPPGLVVFDPCGPEGKYWEPKPLPFWRRWFA